MSETLFDLLVVETEISGPTNSVLEKALANIEKQRETQIFDKFGRDIKSASIDYTVIIQPKAEGKKPEAITSTSTKSYEDAVAKASKDGKVEYEETVTLKLVEKFKVPYILEKARASAPSKRRLLSALEREERTLRERYGNDMTKEPNDVHYSVAFHTGVWNEDKGRPNGAVAGVGISRTSLVEAMDKAAEDTGKAKHRGELYAGTHTFKIYMTAQVKDLVEAEARAREEAKEAKASSGALVGAGASSRSSGRTYGGGGTMSYAASAPTKTDLF